jgi:GDPmannose 4,6-dehydratase
VKKALITGIGGQDGSYLAEHLISEGYYVLGTTRSRGFSYTIRSLLEKYPKQLEVHQLDPLDLSAINSLLSAVKPSEIYLLGSMSSVGQSFLEPGNCFESVYGSVENFIRAIELQGRDVALFHPSSSEMYGNSTSPANELTPFKAVSPYGQAKIEAHRLVVEKRTRLSLNFVNGILFNHESPRRNPSFFSRKVVLGAIEILQKKKDLLTLGYLDGVRDWGWAPDVVRGMHQTLLSEKRNDYVFATGKGTSLKEFAQKVFDTLSINFDEHVLTDSELLRPNDIQYSVGDPSLICKELGWAAEVDFPTLVTLLVDDSLKGL